MRLGYEQLFPKHPKTHVLLPNHNLSAPTGLLLRKPWIDFALLANSESYASLMFPALLSRQLAVVEKLLRAGANPHSQCTWPLIDLSLKTTKLATITGNNFLHVTAILSIWDPKLDTADLARTLISYGVDKDKRNSSGMTPLHLAARHDDVGLLRALLDEGADVAALTGDGDTVMDWVLHSDSRNCIAVLQQDTHAHQGEE